MNLLLSALTLLLLLAHTAAYSLPGQWRLKNLDGEPAAISITLGIIESIEKNGHITNALEFHNCNHLSYKVNVNQNYMWFNDKKIEKTDSQDNKQQTAVNLCSQEETKLQQRISQVLKKVFFFAIKNDLLVFVSPNGNDLFEFQRVKKVYQRSLIGNWVLDEIYWRRASQTQVQITKQKMTFCDGNVQATYQTNNIDKISFTITKSQGCQDADLVKALPNIRFFRIKETQLQLYNQDSIENIQLFYQDGGDNLKETQKTVQKNEDSKGSSVTIVEIQDPNNLSNNLRLQSP